MLVNLKLFKLTPIQFPDFFVVAARSSLNILLRKLEVWSPTALPPNLAQTLDSSVLLNECSVCKIGVIKVPVSLKKKV